MLEINLDIRSNHKYPIWFLRNIDSWIFGIFLCNRFSHEPRNIPVYKNCLCGNLKCLVSRFNFLAIPKNTLFLPVVYSLTNSLKNYVWPSGCALKSPRLKSCLSWARE